MPGGTITLEDRIAERLPPRLRTAWLAVDESVTGFMRCYGPETLRVAVALVFIWFGALKLAGRSPVADTVYWVPPGFFVRFLGVWEIVV